MKGAGPALAWTPSDAPDWRDKLRWRCNRLRCMSPAEVVHRVARAVQVRRERRAAHWLQPVPAANVAAIPRAWMEIPQGLDAAPYRAAADAFLAGRFDVFALRGLPLGRGPHGVPDWNCDPRTGTLAPRVFGKSLDYRDPRLVGDIKYLWEPSRHLHLVTFAQAWRLSGDLRYLDALRAHLESWFEDCPYPCGPHWASALEAGLRLINWSIAWQIAGGLASPLFEATEGKAFRERWLASVYRHSTFIEGFFSLHSSANNHLLGEAAGLLLAAQTWPCWAESEGWERTSRALLEEHGLAQNAPDGVNREQAISYQQFSFDLLLLPLLSAKAVGRPLSGALSARMEAMLEYIASVMDVGGRLPMFGDADDAYAVRLSPQPGFCRYRSLLATGAVLYRRGDFKAKAGSLDDKTRWLLGESARRFDSLDATNARLPVRRAFPEGGYYILGWDFEQPSEARLVVDAGPLGYRAIAAHGHADALSFTLSLGGRECFVDPGTYAYHTQGAWRAYFRGTAAHNTVRIDGRDQSEQGGNFLWLAKARAGCEEWRVSGDEDVFEGWHDGYRRLADPVLHRRRIAVDKRAHRIVLRDRLEMRGRHVVELRFHLAEGCGVECESAAVRVIQGDRSLRLILPSWPDARLQLLRGSSTPIGGWVSRAYDEKVPAWTLAWSATCEGPVSLESVIDCG